MGTGDMEATIPSSLAEDWLVRTLRRAISDLSNDELDYDTLDSLRVSLELVFRELEVRVVTCTNARSYQEAAECVRRALLIVTRFVDVLWQQGPCTGYAPTLSLPDGGVGRPRYNVGYNQLTFLLENRFTIPQVSEMMGVSVRTIRRRMDQYGLSVHQMYTVISDTDLCHRVSVIQQLHPNCGNRQMHGILLSQGIRVTQERLRECQRSIDPEGSSLRRLQLIRRRVYRVAAPLSLWHIDSNHKLIR